MTVAVRGKLSTTGPLMSESPNHLCLVLLIECVPRINEEEPPVLLMGVLLLQQSHCMYPILYPFLHAIGYLFCTVSGLSLLPRHL